MMGLLFAPEKQKTDASLFGHYTFGKKLKGDECQLLMKGWHLLLSALPGSLRNWGKVACSLQQTDQKHVRSYAELQRVEIE